jgi:hypothetical protein
MTMGESRCDGWRLMLLVAQHAAKLRLKAGTVSLQFCFEYWHICTYSKLNAHIHCDGLKMLDILPIPKEYGRNWLIPKDVNKLTSSRKK